MSSDIAIALDRISKTYLLYPSPTARLKQFILRGAKNYFRPVEALRPLSLTLRKGETIGIVGRNGSGKSTLLQLICGTLNPTTGTVEVRGRVAALLELGAGFNMEFSGRENMYLNGSVLGLTREQIHAKAASIEAFAGIGHFIDQPVKTYSSGMVVRLAFAIATAVEPDIFIVDEALAVGDEAFQRKCYARIRELQDHGCAILFVSHAAQSVVDLCDRALLLDAGELLLDGDPKTIITAYHQLIYAQMEAQPALRASILSGEWERMRGESETPLSAQSIAAPESRTEYSSHGAVISDPRLINENGNEVNLLKPGALYTYTYRVTFAQTVPRVRFGMMIKTPTGFELCGASGAGSTLTLPQVEAGTSLMVRFTFRCPFLQGTYYLNCGVTQMDEAGLEVFLHRIVDACQFRVMSDATSVRGATILTNGIIDAAITCEVNA